MGNPIRLPVCNLSCDFKATCVMPTKSWNGMPVHWSHDHNVPLFNEWTSGAKKSLERW